MRFVFIFIFILIFSIKPSLSQIDSIECLKQISVYRELYKLNYKQQAYAHWQKCYQTEKTNRQRLCADGEKYLTELIQNQNNKIILTDSLLLIYNEQKKYYSNKALIELKQAIALFNYGEKTPENLHLAKKNFESAFNTYQEKYPTQAILPYYYTLSKLLDIQSVDANYFFTSTIPLILFAAKNQYKELWKEIQLDFVEKTQKNTEEFEAILYTLTFSEQATLITQIGMTQFKQQNKPSDWIINWLYTTNADSISHISPEKCSEFYFLQAGVYFESGKLAEAKNAALKSIECKANDLSYLLLGEIYIQAATKNPEIYEPAIFCLAADQYHKAAQVNPALKDSAEKKIKWLQQYFPSQEDAFFLGIKNNSVYQLGSWINESTTIRFRENAIN